MAFNSLQVELLTALTFDQELCITNVVLLINPAATEKLESVKISKLEVFSNNEAGLKSKILNFQNTNSNAIIMITYVNDLLPVAY